ncbi:P-loop containing nucleoside triphosphate hydrolase protein [Macrolepiota fuliginosa MF-IS2]|uniref:P-loop containing nucleoside triphosphate hydrolase protein n=1 Tax=Macrolepiota fuliginosa MF-IS2 TaxID=1400762 RepID=A0A9P5XH45_9AGAR|nr:P-loop containing nucleoside triphosphate hydrolase protein [Macrolepiota fuliginosa MF-IS2]
MPRFEFEASVVLAVCAVSSAVVGWFTREKEGTVRLPMHVGEEGNPAGSGGEDPFDVTRPEDVVDGYPLDADEFWKRMRWRKLIMSVLLVSVVAINAASLGWSIANNDTRAIISSALQIASSVYLLILAGCSINQSDVYSHTKAVIHVAVLSTITVALFCTIAILPGTPLASVAGKSDRAPLGLWYTTLALYALVFAISIRMPLGPKLYFPPERIYSEKTISAITNKDEENVCGIVGASIWDVLLFSYTTKVVWLGNVAESLDIGDLPVVPGDMRATFNYSRMKRAMREVKLRIGSWSPKPGSGWSLIYRLVRLNILAFAAQFGLAVTSAMLFYTPAIFLKELVAYLEVDGARENLAWGWVYVIGLFMSNAVTFLVTGQLWSLSTTSLQVRFRIQLNSILFAKTLVRKDVASSTPPAQEDEAVSTKASDETTKKDDEDDFSSKAQIMTLMTTDVDRVSEFPWHAFSLIDSPIEITIGTIFLYNLLGISSFFGLGVTCLFLPLNHLAGKIVVGAQENLMKARDERVALMNEVLGGIRMLKFMAWERSFEARVLKIREKELKFQKLNYNIETLWNAIWNGTPILVTLVSFWHYAIVRQQPLTPSIAFTSIMVFSEMKFALSVLPETFINMLQSFVSLRRIEKYLSGGEVKSVPPLDHQDKTIALQSCTLTWPQDRSMTSAAPSVAPTPRQKFVLTDLTLSFPEGELSLICGKLGSGKTLLLLSLLGEADVLAGQLLCPRSPPDSLALYSDCVISKDEWIVQGSTAYVPQAAWLRNASIRDNILFNLPYNEERYQKTLEVCALLSDLAILEDGDESEIGERGVNLSGGQKARVSLARAVYSRASVLLLDDVLSAVDAHTAYHLYTECLKGELMHGRTVILVSHHVQLCAPGAKYIVALDNGRLQFEGSSEAFFVSSAMRTLLQSTDGTPATDEEEKEVLTKAEEEVLNVSENTGESSSEASSTIAPAPSETKKERKAPRKLIEEEKRAVGRIGRDIWETYIWACGDGWYWSIFISILIAASISPVAENGWLRYWSATATNSDAESPVFYITVYAIITAAGLVISTIRWFVLYRGSIHASTVLYKRLLETVLFANIRFHDTVSRGRLLNRFGKDFEGIDSSLSDNFGRSIIYGLSAITTLVTVSVVGGLPFIFAAVILGAIYWNVAKVYGQTSRDMRRLDSVTRSPLYSIYGETISGVTIIRAFGASSKFLRDMLRCVDTNSNPYYWMWGVNRWLSVRFNLVSAAIVGATGLVCLVTPTISASFAGFALAFASTITNDLLFMVRRFVGLEQSMVALERVKEYSELKREPPEFVEPRPPASWPSQGAIRCEDLVIRYAPDLPDVLHRLNFEIHPGEKVGILGRTGSGKSTLALSFFRFVEPTEGRILIDDLDTSSVGLTDLRSRLTIIPQDPTILSGTLRSTLDVFSEYDDAEIYEALRRVHLIPSVDIPTEATDTVNANAFRDLDNAVSEGGENFSTGEKQLLCMARAILKRAKVLVMDEATASVDYATDELIGKTIRQEFAESTILTIAHRLRTVIDYDRVMLLEDGRIAEFDKPSVLLSDPSSKFYSLCKATGKDEFTVLKKMAGG